MPLAEYLKRPRRPIEVIAMVEALAELLTMLHANGRVHRDIKPDNVLWLTTSTTWRLMDMGITVPAGAVLCSCTLQASMWQRCCDE